jgi:uncharacterized phage protein gp47/JayE
MTIQYDSSGIITQNLSEILAERETALQPVMGEDFVVDKTTPVGNMELADSDRELSIQELIAWLFPNQMDANTAEGIFLDAICEKNRIYRYQPAYTKLNLTITGTPKTSFNSGDIIIQDKTSTIYYDLNEDCTVGDDGTVVAEFKCEDFGEYYPTENTTLVIQTPVVGLDSVTYDSETANITLGRLTETDTELRRRRQYSVGQTSTNTLESIKAVLYSTDGVKHVRSFENDTEETNEDGLPMKSFEMVVDGGDEDDITDKIFNNKPIGTRAYGTTTKIKTDSEGNVYEIGYTKVGVVNVGLDIKIKVSTFQSNSWMTEVKNAIIDKFEDIQDIGTEVKYYNYFQTISSFEDVTDIEEVLFYNLEDEDNKTSNLKLGKKQIAKISADDISIQTSLG